MKALRMDLGGLGPWFVLVWSSGYVVGALATRYSAPFAITLWRFVIAAAVLGGIAWWRSEAWPTAPGALARTAATGVVAYAVQFCALYQGLSDGMPAATTALVTCSAPLVVAVAGAVLGWDRLGGRQWVGVVLGVIGVATTVSDRLGRPPSVHALLWTVLGLGGLAGGSLLQSRLIGLGGATALTAVQVAAGAVATAVVAPLAGPPTIALTVPALATFAWLALVTGVGAPLLLFALIARRGATQGTSLLFVVPGVTALAGWPLLGQPVGAVAVLGLVVAALGLWLGRRPAGAVPARRTPTTGVEQREPVASR